MDEDILQKVSELKSNASALLNQVTEYLENKQKSTNKQISNKNISEIKNFLDQASKNFETAVNLVIDCKSNNELLVEKIENALSNANTNIQPRSVPSFAQIIKHQTTKQQILRSQNNNSEETILVSAKPNCSPVSVALQTAEAIKSIRSKRKSLKINKLIKTNKGAVIKIPREEDIDNLINEFQHIDSLTVQASIYKPKKLDPVVVLKAVSKQTPIAEIPKLICDPNLNPHLAGCENKMLVLFAIKSIRDYNDVVLRVNPFVYETLMSSGFIYSDLEKIFVKDKTMVRQCQKCYKFDHKTIQCSSPKLCPKCGGVSDVNHTCPNLYRCLNCASHTKYKNDDLNHPPNKPSCPIYNDQIKRLINMTCYEGLNHDIVQTKQSFSSQHHG